MIEDVVVRELWRSVREADTAVANARAMLDIVLPGDRQAEDCRAKLAAARTALILMRRRLNKEKPGEPG